MRTANISNNPSRLSMAVRQKIGAFVDHDMHDLFEAVGCDGDSDEDAGRRHNYWHSILTGTAKEIFTAAANKLIAENDVKMAAEK